MVGCLALCGLSALLEFGTLLVVTRAALRLKPLVVGTHPPSFIVTSLDWIEIAFFSIEGAFVLSTVILLILIVFRVPKKFTAKVFWSGFFEFFLEMAASTACHLVMFGCAATIGAWGPPNDAIDWGVVILGSLLFYILMIAFLAAMVAATISSASLKIRVL